MEAILSVDPRSDGAVFEPGELGESWSDWTGGLAISVQSEGEGSPVTTLTGTVDQAALHSLVRQLDSPGLPLMSAIGVVDGLKDSGISN